MIWMCFLNNYLMFKISEKYAEIIFILGIIVSLFSFFFFLPVIVSLIYKEDVHLIFASIGVFSLLIGVGISFVFKSPLEEFESKRELQPRDGFLLVVLVWIVLSLISSLPFYLHFEKLSLIAALFEAISGLTTTGNI